MRKASQDATYKPRHPLLSAMGFVAALPIAERFFRNKHIYRSNSHFAAERSQELVARLARGEAAYLAGISIGGFHNTGSSATMRKNGSRAESTNASSSDRRSCTYGYRPCLVTLG
jgi:hypothetical protein